MTQEKMIKDLQERFGLSKVQANVIYFSLQEHFLKRQQSVSNSKS